MGFNEKYNTWRATLAKTIFPIPSNVDKTRYNWLNKTHKGDHVQFFLRCVLRSLVREHAYDVFSAGLLQANAFVLHPCDLRGVSRSWVKQQYEQ